MTRTYILGGCGLAVLLLAGCGDDTAAPASRPATHAASAAPAPAPAASPFAPPSAASDSASPSSPPADDPLAAGGDSLAPAADTPPSPGPTGLADVTPKMPTAHSHWLRGAVINARVAVALNGLPLGEYRAPMDQDITMRLRPGLNTVTFTYTPENGTSMAHLDLLESEHHPAIAPLASFASPVAEFGKPQSPITKTYTFQAR